MTQSEYDADWEVRWKRGITPGVGFDLDGPHVALVKMLQDKEIDVKDKRAVVPGCGRGYDAIQLAENGALVDGLEIAETAVAEANSYLMKYNTEHNSTVSVTYKRVNFFDHDGEYDIGYDYTFACAIHPEQRPLWGQKWSQLITPGGELIVFLFPIKFFREKCPPWVFTPEQVSELLQNDFECQLLEAMPENLTPRHREGLEVRMIWKRKQSSN